MSTIKGDPPRRMFERIAQQDGTILVTQIAASEWARRSLEALIALDLVEVCDHPTVKDRKGGYAAALRLTADGKKLRADNETYEVYGTRTGRLET